MKKPIIIILIILAWINVKAAPDNISNLLIEEVSFTNRGVVIAGSLVRPNIPSQCPAIILIDGSGKTKRRIKYARMLAENRIAVLTYDKRGVGESGGRYISRGNASPQNLELLASDAIEGISLLMMHDKIDKQKIGVWGGSQGGWIASLVASSCKQVSFMVLLSAPSTSVIKEMRYSKLAGNDPDFFAKYSPEKINRELDKKHLLDWFRRDFDPAPYLEKINIPVLWIYGERDRSCPVSSSVNILNNLEKNNFEIKIYPDSGHSLRFPNSKFAPAREINEFFINWIHALE